MTTCIGQLILSHGDGQAQTNLNVSLTYALAFGKLDANTKLALLAIRDRQGAAVNNGDGCVSLFYSEAAVVVNALQSSPVPLPGQATQLLRSLTGYAVGSDETGVGTSIPTLSLPPPAANATGGRGQWINLGVVGITTGVLLGMLVSAFSLSVVPSDAADILLAWNARIYGMNACVGLTSTACSIWKAVWEQRNSRHT